MVNSITLTGELTFNTASDFYQRGQAFMKKYPCLQLDFSGITDCDSAALVLLLAWLRDANQWNRTLNFSHIPAKLLAIASMSGLKQILLTARVEHG